MTDSDLGAFPTHPGEVIKDEINQFEAYHGRVVSPLTAVIPKDDYLPKTLLGFSARGLSELPRFGRALSPLTAIIPWMTIYLSIF